LAPATLTVNTLADNTTDTGFLTLRDAVLLVNNGGDPTALGQSSMPGGWSSQIAGSFGSNDTIQFDPSLTASAPQTITLGGSELLLSQNVSITGPGASLLAVSGNNASRVFEVASGTTDTISGLTIENGRSGYLGGGISNGSGSLTVNNCTLSSNRGSFGGGIYNGGGTVTVSGSTLSNNSAGYGGGITGFGTLTLSGTTLSSNSASEGGGILNGGTVTVSGCTLSNNSATDVGGGIDMQFGTLTVSGCTLSNNSAHLGGGIADYDCTATVSDCVLSGNSAYNGGAIADEGTVTVSGCSLSGNNATGTGGPTGAGGGIEVRPGSTLTVSDSSTISGNSAVYAGGGIDNYGGTVTISGSTICGNSAPVGADLNNYGIFTLTNSDVCVIALAPTITTVSSSISPSVLGQAVTFTAALNFFGSQRPTGTLTFLLDGTTTLGTSTLDNFPAATITTAGLAVGTHTITASYSGDNNNAGSTSGAFTQTVLSAQQETGLIVDQVNSLVSGGSLSTGNGTALTTKLNSAVASLNGGYTTAGVNQLNAFINQVTAFQKNGKLTSDQAQALISAANLAITAASGGSGAHLTNQDASAASGSTDTQPVSDAGQLVTGAIGVYLDNADGTPINADEQARFDDAIQALDTTFGSYGVNLVDVGATDAADAIVQVEIAATSAAGSAADGVLGCTVAGHITLLTGWNWYTGADPSAISAGQYDFETIVTHELGHAIGLGHSGDTNSVMYPYLASGVVSRAVTTQDMSVLEAATGTTPEPLLAAPWRETPVAAPPISTAPHLVGSNGVGLDVGSGAGAGIGQAMPTSNLARNLFFALLSAAPDELPLGSRQLSGRSAEPGRMESLAGRDAFFGSVRAERLPSQNFEVSDATSSSPIFAGAWTDQDEDAPVVVDASQPDVCAAMIDSRSERAPCVGSAAVNDAP
jgi:hypothetical protein